MGVESTPKNTAAHCMKVTAAAKKVKMLVRINQHTN